MRKTIIPLILTSFLLLSACDKSDEKFSESSEEVVSSSVQSLGENVETVTKTIRSFVRNGRWKHHGSIKNETGFFVVKMIPIGSSGNADLYTKEGRRASVLQYDCRPMRRDSNETCQANGAGKYFISVKGQTRYSRYQLKITYNRYKEQERCIPSREICDGKDNDCDGSIDEGIIKSCSTQCGRGTQSCINGDWGSCNAPLPTREICDGRDNDCNGIIDDGVQKSCSTQCGRGTQSCINGDWGSCNAPQPTREICDGIDNDCDGSTDENLTQSCYNNEGSGEQTCENGSWGVCDIITPFLLCGEGTTEIDGICICEYTPLDPQCGNETVDPGELCDGGTTLCTNLGHAYVSGTALCNNECTGFDTLACNTESVCGNGLYEADEFCDGNSIDCIEINPDLFILGTAVCNPFCNNWDVTACIDKPQAELIFADGGSYNFENVIPGNTVEYSFIVQIEGESAQINDTNLLEPFYFKNGSYPGTGGTCGLLITEECNIVVEYSPDTNGSYSGELELLYNDSKKVTIALMGTSGDTGAFLVKNTNIQLGQSNIKSMVKAENQFFFTGNTGLGVELFKSDGTFDTTNMILDINDGIDSSNPTSMIANGNNLVFIADDGINGKTLWASDGTEAGSIRLTDFEPKSGFAVLNGHVYFAVYDYNNPISGLWKTNGTVEGTLQVLEHDGLSNYGSSCNLANINNMLYFSASSTETGIELWKSDGTEAGTVLLKDINPGNLSSNPNKFTKVNGILYFSAVDATFGRELWRSNGTEEGTVMVKDMTAGTEDTNFSELIEIDGNLYFSTYTLNGYSTNSRQLWFSDGTPEGTIHLKTITGINSGQLSNLTELNGELYFVGQNMYMNAHSEIWKSDGTVEGTFKVTNFTTSQQSISYLINHNGYLYFSARTDLGKELWRSDGTADGTQLVKDINEGSSQSEPMYLMSYKNKVYFAADDGEYGSELWASDGTEIGTYMLKDLTPGDSDISLKQSVSLNGKMFFIKPESFSSTYTGIPYNIFWVSDGTEAGTTRFTDYKAPSSIGFAGKIGLATAANKVWMVTNDYYGDGELLASDGTDEGTTIVSTYGTTSLKEFTAVNDIVFYLVEGKQLWKSNGTADGTSHVYTKSALKNLTELNGTLYFLNRNSSSRYELWKSDGTNAGTVMVKNLNGSYINGLVSCGSRLVFNFSDDLWTSDGTDAGTVKVFDFKYNSANNTKNFNDYLGNIIFTTVDEDQLFGNELWISDGTALGTTLLKDIKSGNNGSDPKDFVIYNAELYFTADDGINGRELWKTNGTTAGTFMVKNISIGLSSSQPTQLTVSGDHLFFIANDGFGKEIWKTNGTNAGTIKITDEYATSYSYPDNLIDVSGTLFFTAKDNIHGTELWKFIF